jgi:2-polyprenyl-3-methyl-5-hydroxy-6-metoxy-1,4-benzoquinol methylase
MSTTATQRSSRKRLDAEQRFHELQARQRATEGVSLRFKDDEYLDHETWIRFAFEQLGDVGGLRVLDFGCGHAMAAVVLARAGAQVTAIDLSAGYLEEARERARANGVSIDLVKANGEQLPFADGAFDCVWGNAILHHLDLSRTAAAVKRVLRKGGRAVFCEPWGGNPLLSFARSRLPYPGKQRTPDETPLTGMQLRQLRAVFPKVRVRGFQLLSMASRLTRKRRFRRQLDWCDAMLLDRVPMLEHFCRYVVLTLQTGE